MLQDEALAGLRALRLPPENISIWSDLGLAVAAGLLAAIVMTAALCAFSRPRGSLRATTLEAFAAAQDLPVAERRAAQAALLRRIARTVEGEAAARTTGPAWSETLDRIFGTDFFAAREGRVFAEGLYRRPENGTRDDGALDRELACLLAKLGRR